MAAEFEAESAPAVHNLAVANPRGGPLKADYKRQFEGVAWRFQFRSGLAPLLQLQEFAGHVAGDFDGFRDGAALCQ